MKRKYWHRLIRPSTVEFFREGRNTPEYSWLDGLHGYIYGRWPYLYIGIGKGDHPLSKRLGPIYQAIMGLFPANQAAQNSEDAHSPTNRRSKKPELSAQASTQTFADGYHGKVMPLESAQRLVQVGEDIRIHNLEKVIPYTKARDIILKNPDHILALECPCRSSRLDPCLPLDVCLIVGEPFASFVSEHHPLRSRWISQDEAVKILSEEDERGHAHHAFFKDAMLGRFYAICNCCSCCCGAMQSHQRGTPMLASSGFICEVDENLCIACGDCVVYCQFGALSLDRYTSSIDQERCMGCGVCVSKCDEGALSLRRELIRGEPLEIVNLMRQSLNS